RPGCAHRAVLALLGRRGLGDSPWCGQKRWSPFLWSGQLHDDRPVLLDVVALARSLLARSAMAKIAAKRWSTTRIISTRFTAPFECHLFFRRSHQVSGERVVGWHKYLARSDPTTIQHGCT